jgi:fatty acid desaturase
MSPPSASTVAHLRPTDALGLAYTALCVTLTATGLGLASLRGSPLGWVAWAVGQGVLAIALLQWFVLLHECGHGVLFRSRLLNRMVGHLAGFFSTLPFTSWRAIHNTHHKWTGWQDLDPTTQSLVPRTLKPSERWLMNVCWRFWIPAFTVIYRVSNFWNLPRLARMERVDQRSVALEVVVLLTAYVALFLWIGPLALLVSVGPGFLLSLMLIEPIMMSQHTHVPQQLSGGQRVSAVPAPEQAVYTRSLVFPAWFSRFVLLGFDAHELHHVYPAVPGYLLWRVDWAPPGRFTWWRWVLAARAMRGEAFLFSNREETGAEV